MKKLKSLWALAAILAIGAVLALTLGITPKAMAVTSPIQITVVNQNVTITVATGVGAGMKLANITHGEYFVLDATKVLIPDSGITHTYPNLPAGVYRLIILDENGVAFSPQPLAPPGLDFTVKAATTTPSPSVTTTTPKPECVTLTAANIDHYGELTGNREISMTIKLKGKTSDYCNDWSFVGVGYTISNPANIWVPAQVVASVNTKSVGKSGLTATATVPATTCGQNDWYEGTGPAVGSLLAGPGQGYEATHKFLHQIFGGAPTYYQNISKCATVTPSPSVTVTIAVPTPSATQPTTVVPTASASSSAPAAAVVATCSAGKVLVSGNCVTPKVPDTGSSGTPLMTSIGTVAPIGAAAAVLGLVGFFLYRKMTRVV